MQNPEKNRLLVGSLLLIIGALVGFGASQMTVAKEVTDKLQHIQEGWNAQFSALRSDVDKSTIKIANLVDSDNRQLNAINGLHPIIEAAVQQNTLLLAWLKNNPLPHQNP